MTDRFNNGKPENDQAYVGGGLLGNGYDPTSPLYWHGGDFVGLTEKLPYIKNLERFGITANLRIIDSAQYSNRADDFDYDMVVGVPAQSSNPGNEQREYWGSAAAATRGSNNTAGMAAA